MTKSAQNIYTVDEVATLFRVTRRHIEHLCDRGIIKHERVGRVIRINGPYLRKTYPHLFPSGVPVNA